MGQHVEVVRIQIGGREGQVIRMRNEVGPKREIGS